MLSHISVDILLWISIKSLKIRWNTPRTPLASFERNASLNRAKWNLQPSSAMGLQKANYKTRNSSSHYLPEPNTPKAQSSLFSLFHPHAATSLSCSDLRPEACEPAIQALFLSFFVSQSNYFTQSPNTSHTKPSTEIPLLFTHLDPPSLLRLQQGQTALVSRST